MQTDRYTLMPYYVYIVTNKTRSTLYTGFTGDVLRRAFQHKEGAAEGFSARYRTKRLVYVEEHEDVHEAIRREKQIKGWRRAWKEELIESVNPAWEDLSEKWRM